ncbi:DNA cytosine methyltransferase, partial [bacterium]|nr:DNA cytosine methyltransferase [bacterium]
CDLLTYSFPCTSVSLSGSMEGLTKGSGTSSSLLWECQKIIEAKMPKYLLMENNFSFNFFFYVERIV